MEGGGGDEGIGEGLLGGGGMFSGLGMDDWVDGMGWDGMEMIRNPLYDLFI